MTFSIPTGLIEDSRGGLSKSVSMSLQYSAQASLGQYTDGLDMVVFFDKAPYTIKKETFKIIATETQWQLLFDAMLQSYLDFSVSESGIHLDTVNPGSKLVMDSIIYFDGSYSVSTYSNVPSTILSSNTGIYNLTEFKTINVPVGGHWEGDSIAVNKKLYFNTVVYGEQAVRTYIAQDATESVGDLITVAGLIGRVTSVSKSNPRYLGHGSLNTKVYDISVSIQSQTGKTIV